MRCCARRCDRHAPTSPRTPRSRGWRPDSLWGRRPAFIYSIPAGEKIIGAKGQIPLLNETQLLKNFIQPAIQLIRDLVLIGSPAEGVTP